MKTKTTKVKAGEVQGVWKKHYDQTVIIAKEVNAVFFIEKLTTFVNLSPETIIDDSLVMEITTEYFKIASEAKAKAEIELLLMERKYNRAAVVAAGSFNGDKTTSAKYLTQVLDQLLSLNTFFAADEAHIIIAACCKEHPERVSYLMRVLAICNREGNNEKAFIVAMHLIKTLPKEKLELLKNQSNESMRKFIDKMLAEATD